MPNLIDAVQMNGVDIIGTDGALKSNLRSVLGSISLGSGDVTLTATQAKNEIIEVTTGHASNAIIVPNTKGARFTVVNKDGSLAAKIKVSGQIGVTVASGKTASVYCNGTDVARLTADV